MATALAPQARSTREGERRFLLTGVGWEGYEALLKIIGDGHTRVTYDRGDVELMSPSRQHEIYAELIGLIVRTAAEGLGLPCHGARSTTWRKQVGEAGLEADNCYYLASFPRIRGKKDLDLNVDPPPDLAVEIEISRGALNRLGVYARLGVPEVWRFDGEHLVIHTLQNDGTYSTGSESAALRTLTVDDIAHWVRFGDEIGDQSEWGQLLREWVRAELLPRR